MVERVVPSSSARRPTLVDIARECGLSRATVARALSGKGYVDLDRRRLIQETADRLGYRTSTIARALRTQRTSSIGVLIADITNPIFPQIVKGIDEIVSGDGHTMFLSNTDEDPQKQVAIMRSLLDRQVDGIVMVSQTLANETLKLLERGPPCVFVNRRPHEGVDYVGPDNEQGIELLLAHLRGLGHRRIAYVSGPAHSSTSRERLAHFRVSMMAYGLEVDERLVFSGNYYKESGAKAAEAFMSVTPRPTAVIAANDFVALGVVGYLHSIGLSVPADISVTGFDDVFDFSLMETEALKVEGLTTVHQPKRHLGRAAGKLLLERLGEPDTPGRKVILPTELRIRDTTGPVEGG
ncbi:LacI family DNA-binding transcriptional regulator [Pseudorhizobium marinum]|uniref:LacI family DNA-binding transcriptional regulator n=1 Tax=Pseudorhizobium marinum TaxID=1496690 RepID=UPI000498644F|nr:LacI family DNA-binding transcriptional regulator [Pseudorhizobium marinum]